MNTFNFLFRKASHSDIENLIHLLHILFDIEDIPFDESKHRKALQMIFDENNACIMVAETQKKIVGMCAAQLFISTAEGGYAAFIEDIVVEPEYQQKGVANRLLKEMEQWAKNNNVKRLQLFVHHNNEPAKKLYYQHGFQLTPCAFMKRNL